MLGNALDVGPSHLGVGTEFLSLDECDLAVADVKQVLQCYLGCTLVVEHNVGYAFHVVVPGHGDYRYGKIQVPGGIHGDQAVHRSLQEHAWIFVDEIGAVAVAGYKVEVSFLEKIIFYAAHNGRGISVAHFGDDDSDGEAALSAQGAGEEVGTIFEFSGGGEDSVLGILRDGVGHARPVDDEGDGGWGKVEVLGQLFEAHRLAGGMRGSVTGWFSVAWFGLLRGHGAQSRTMKSRRQAEISILLFLHFFLYKLLCY